MLLHLSASPSLLSLLAIVLEWVELDDQEDLDNDNDNDESVGGFCPCCSVLFVFFLCLLVICTANTTVRL